MFEIGLLVIAIVGLVVSILALQEQKEYYEFQEYRINRQRKEFLRRLYADDDYNVV